jgi:hypothetical protein
LIVGSAFYSPDVPSLGGQSHGLHGLRRNAERTTHRFAGYRWFELDLLMREERKLQNELFAGVKWQLR